MIPSQSNDRDPTRRARWPIAAAALALAAAGCSSDLIRYLLGQPTGETPRPAVAAAVPDEDTTAAPGAEALIRWADVATASGTVVSVRAQRKNETDENVGDPLLLVDGRDALADGESDIFRWNVEGVRVGNYEITVTISSPDGFTASDIANGRFMVTTALTVPTLTFTNPGASDVTFTPGGSVTITWTDNGDDNASATVRLGLDRDFIHDNGNEIDLLLDEPLNASGNTGAFTFTGVDVNGTAVPAESYIVFALVDDGANDIVTAEATGRLIVAP